MSGMLGWGLSKIDDFEWEPDLGRLIANRRDLYYDDLPYYIVVDGHLHSLVFEHISHDIINGLHLYQLEKDHAKRFSEFKNIYVVIRE